jgi:transcriptional regulator with XRE-family HTH domain
MDRAKRKRLEEAGWQVGSAADFLGLTDEETVYIDLRVRLADALKARRRAAKLSQKAFATAMRSSQSRIAKVEANNHTVSLDLLIRSLIALGVSLEELGRILGVNQSDASLGRATASQKAKRKETKQSRKSTKKSSVKAA